MTTTKAPLTPDSIIQLRAIDAIPVANALKNAITNFNEVAALLSAISKITETESDVSRLAHLGKSVSNDTANYLERITDEFEKSLGGASA